MIDPEKNDEINDFFYVHLTVGALLAALGLAYVLSEITLWAVNSENKHLKWGLICLYNLLISFMPKVRLFLSPLMVPELNWQIYRYTGGFFFIFAGHITNKFFNMIFIGLYVLFFYCIAKHEADSKKDKN
jgi:hypothetical protein